MIDKIDIGVAYLYYDGFRYDVVQVDRINEKSVRIRGSAVNKTHFMENAILLTEEEFNLFKGEYLKSISVLNSKITRFLNNVVTLKECLECNEFTTVNTDKLQNALDRLESEISDYIDGEVSIDGEKYKFGQFSKRTLEKVSK